MELQVSDATWVAFDLETTGKYPFQSEICEIAAVKWRDNKIIEELEFLVKPSHKIPQEVIEIHGITNEMVAEAKTIDQVLPSFYRFIRDSYVIAHHSPFDLGFVCIELEHLNLVLPDKSAFCSSLLSRSLIPESPNHRLQTLSKFLKIDSGQAHRALDDAKTCLAVSLECFQRFGWNKKLSELEKKQNKVIRWSDFSISALRASPAYAPIIEALLANKDVEITYEGGSRPGKPRPIKPLGLVRQPQNDFLVGLDGKSDVAKRYFLNKISASKV